MLGQRLHIAILPQLFDQPRRALDICEEQRHAAGRKIHAHASRSSAAKDRTSSSRSLPASHHSAGPVCGNDSRASPVACLLAWDGVDVAERDEARRGVRVAAARTRTQPRYALVTEWSASAVAGPCVKSRSATYPPIRTAGVDWASERSARPIETSALGCAAGRAISPPRASSPSRSRQGQRRDSTTPDRGTGRFRRSGTNGGRGRSMARGSRYDPDAIVIEPDRECAYRAKRSSAATMRARFIPKSPCSAELVR